MGGNCSPSARTEDSVFHLHLHQMARPAVTIASAVAAALGLGPVGSAVVASGSLPSPVPAVADYQFLSGSATPPSEMNCFSVGRRCFTSMSMQNSYNLPPLYAAGDRGQGMTIAIIDSFGNPNIASDLGNFDTQMSLPHMCGEQGVTCTPGMPAFQHVYWDGKTPVKAPPPNSQRTGLQTRNL